MSFIKNSFEITPDVKRFLAKYKNDYDSIATVKILIDGKTGEEYGMISDYTVNSLNRSYEIFTENKVTEDYIKDIQSSIRKEIDTLISSLAEKDYYKKRKKELDVLKKISPHIEVDIGSRYVGDGNAAVYLTLYHEDESVDIEHESLFYNGPGSIEDISWDWLAWLSDEESPFFSDEFVDAYLEHQSLMALSQFSATLDETSFHSDVIEKIKEFTASLAKE